MNGTSKIYIAAVAGLSSLAFAVLAFSGTRTPDDEVPSCLTAGCHEEYGAYAEIHEPVSDGCDMCHELQAEDHPAPEGEDFALSSEMPDLCHNCHDAHEGENVHSPVAEGDCLSCHSPHGGSSSGILTEESVYAVCTGCHDIDTESAASVHEPVGSGECTSCHEVHASANSSLLTEAIPDLCQTCHDEIASQAEMKTIHPPFEDDCFSCHTAHVSETKKLLTSTVPEMCYTCHGEIEEGLPTAKIVHEPVTDEKACNNCHSPHATAAASLLLKDEYNLCKDCHYTRSSRTAAERKLKGGHNRDLLNKKLLHSPVESDGCSSCHEVHIGNNDNLLTTAFPKGPYTSAPETSLAMCFDCHDNEMLTSADATEFKRGNENYHALHIVRDKAIVCTTCHAVHSADVEELINENIPFGDWLMPMRFNKTENGGSCTPGCHKAETYGTIVSTTEPEE